MMRAANQQDGELQELLHTVYARFHYDFRGYSQGALKRRLLDMLPRLGCASIAQLTARLQHDSSIFPQLIGALTIQVSDLFRDPAHFAFLREHIVPVLRTYPSLRLWVAGCAAGEEAYSFAILLEEHGLLARSLIYATDINAEALAKAEAGVYPAHRAARFTTNHQLSGAPCSLSRYYSASYGSIVLSRALRRHIVFSDHSLATDAVFAEVQLVSCRNVLIYFDAELQERTLGLFHDALCRKGFLGLGSQESPLFASFRRRFEPMDPRERWFQRKAVQP